MLFNTGHYLGNGKRLKIDVDFRPQIVIIKNDAAQFASWHVETLWCSRSNVFAAGASFINGIRLCDEGFYVGSDNTVNLDATQHHWLAIGDDGQQDYSIESWIGNATNGRILNLSVNKLAYAGWIKRDSNREGALKVFTNPTIFMAGTAATDCIAFTSPGIVTLTNAVNVNEYDSAGGLGEGIDGVFFYNDSDNAKIAMWTGDAAIGRRIPLGVSQCSGLVVARPSGGSSRIINDTMSPKTGPCSAAVLQSNEGTLTDSNLIIGSNATPLNGNTLVYGAIAFEKKLTGKIEAPFIQVKNKQAIFLPGKIASSYITCGTSDATLKITGAISIEFFGSIWIDPGTTGTDDGPLICRGIGPYGVANGYSWGLHTQNQNDGGLAWAGAQFEIQCSTTMGSGAPLDTNAWRTGILCPFGKRLVHVVSSDDGLGNVKLYVNGVLKKQRANNAVSIVSVAGHETTIGARKSGASYVRSNRVVFKEGSIYAVALTADEIYNRYVIAALDGTATDPTTNLAERWSADSANGAAINAQVNSANNGTIVAGMIITL